MIKSIIMRPIFSQNSFKIRLRRICFDSAPLILERVSKNYNFSGVMRTHRLELEGGIFSLLLILSWIFWIVCLFPQKNGQRMKTLTPNNLEKPSRMDTTNKQNIINWSKSKGRKKLILIFLCGLFNPEILFNNKKL